MGIWDWVKKATAALGGWEWMAVGIGWEALTSLFGGEDEAIAATKEMSAEQLQFMREKFGTSREDVQSVYEGLTPYREAGQFGLETVTRLLENPEEAADLPGYQLGLQAVDRMSSARGDLGGGRHEKELMRYGVSFLNNALAPYMDLASLGRMSVTPSGKPPENALETVSQEADPNALVPPATAVPQNALESMQPSPEDFTGPTVSGGPSIPSAEEIAQILGHEYPEPGYTGLGGLGDAAKEVYGDIKGAVTGFRQNVLNTIRGTDYDVVSPFKSPGGFFSGMPESAYGPQMTGMDVSAIEEMPGFGSLIGF